MASNSPENRDAIRDMFDGMAKEFGWAVQDTRHEVVERMWFGRETTPESVHTLGNPFEKEADGHELYGDDGHEITTDEIGEVNRSDSRDFWEVYGEDRDLEAPEPDF